MANWHPRVLAVVSWLFPVMSVTVGLFAALLLLFVRFLPVISMFETRHDEHLEKSS